MTESKPSPPPRIVICIPAYNEERSIAKVILGARKVTDLVVVCDDGSTDMTAEIADALGAHVIRHQHNMGKGEALGSLIAYARGLDPNVVVTIDGDGQHDPVDVTEMVGPIVRGEADVVIGVRSMRPGVMPRERIIGNKVLDGMTSAKAGEVLHDTQSGLRAYAVRALDSIDFHQHGMAVESQTIIDAAGHGLRIREVPISVKYSGIQQKRNPVSHLTEVFDYLITRTVVDSPLKYLGFPGLLLVVLGIIAGIRVVDIFSVTRQIAIGTALIGAILVIVGIIMFATSLILKLLTARMDGH